MKKYLFIFILLLFIENSFADCTERFKVWPYNGNLIENSFIILNSFGYYKEYIQNLNTEYPVYLVSGSKRIKLEVKELIDNKYMRTQVILQPKEKLIVGKEYFFVIENIPEHDHPKYWNPSKSKYEPVKWKIIASNDKEPPIWTSKPKEVGKTLINFGCGPEEFVDFNYRVKDNSDVFVKAYIKSLSSGNESVMIIKPTKNIIGIGHGMCGGGFNFDEGEEYEVEFILFDLAGNSTSWFGERIKFTKPKQETEFGGPPRDY